MTQFRYFSVIEYVEEPPGDRPRRIGQMKKGEEEGSHIFLPKPGNDLDEMTSVDWERVAVFDLAEYGLGTMGQDGFKEWWNGIVENDEETHEFVEDVVPVMEGEEASHV